MAIIAGRPPRTSDLVSRLPGVRAGQKIREATLATLGVTIPVGEKVRVRHLTPPTTT